MGSLRGVQLGARVMGQPCIVDLLHQGMANQEVSDAGSAVGLALHAEGHGLQAPERQPAVEGRQPCSLRVLTAQ